MSIVTTCMSCSVETDQLLTVLLIYFSVKSIGLLVLLDKFDLDEYPVYRTENNLIFNNSR